MLPKVSFIFSSVILVSVGLFSCTKTSQSQFLNTSTQDEEQAIIDQVSICAAGESLRMFTFESPETLPPLPSDLPDFLEVSPVNESIRFEVCTADDFTFSLRRVLHKMGASIKLDVFSFEPPLKNEKLDNAFFGNSDGLQLDMFNPGSDGSLDEQFGIRFGSLKHNGESFVTIQRVMKTGDEPVAPSSVFFMVGKFVLGDPFIRTGDSALCKLNEGFLKSTFDVQTAHFEVKMCTFMGGGETTGYRILSFSVEDKNEKLPAQDRQKRMFEGDALKILDNKFFHHNACDYFLLKLENVSYGLTSAPMAGCGKTPEGTPQRVIFEEGEHSRHTLFQVQYKGHTLETGFIPRVHFLL